MFVNQISLAKPAMGCHGMGALIDLSLKWTQEGTGP